MVSLTFLGIMLLLDSFFLSNFFVIRALRRFTDIQATMQSGANQKDNLTISSGYNGCCFSDRVESIVKALFIGSIHKEVNTQNYFPGWKEMPLRFGLVSTSAILIIMLVLLSPEILLDRIGVVQFGKKPTELCKADDFETQMELLDQHLNEITNIHLARKQYNYTKVFHEALLNDTTLYGTKGFECHTIRGGLSGNKDDWMDQTKLPASKYGTFFPGYCGAAREYALERAKSETCTKEACACVLNPLGLGCVKKACAEFPYPCPPHTADAEAVLQDYRKQQMQRAYEAEFIKKLIPNNETLAIAKDTAAEITDKILFQLDIAGTVYVVYSCIAMFFPSPLVLFRSPHMNNIKRVVFGVHKLSFMGSMIAIWWGVEYFRAVFYTPDVQIYLQNLWRNPCFVDGEFIRERQEAVSALCEEFIPMKSDWTLTRTTIDHIVEEANSFVDLCSCDFPNQYLRKLVSPSFLSVDEAAEIGFGTKSEFLCTNCFYDESLYLQDKGTAFLGNTTLCTDENFARAQYMTAPESELNWWEIWVASGLLASIAIKVVMGNFGVALLRLADPFSECGGQYEMPPAGYKFGGIQNLKEVKEIKEHVLKIIAGRKTFLWGLISNAALVNMMLSAYVEVIDEDGSFIDMGDLDLDFTLGVVFASIACIVPLVCCCFIQTINKWIAMLPSQAKDDGTGMPIDDEEYIADTDDECIPDTDSEDNPMNTYDHAMNATDNDEDMIVAARTQEDIPPVTDDALMANAYWCNPIELAPTS